MASEQERKEAFLRAWFDVPEGVHWAHGMSNEVEQGISDCFDQAIAAWNTRPAPAATDTGLETVGYAHRGTIGLLLEGAVSKAVIVPKAGGDFKTPVMLVEQAEELLAAITQERDHWKEYSSGQGKLIESGVFVTNDEYVRLTAFEAKLTERHELVLYNEACEYNYEDGYPYAYMAPHPNGQYVSRSQAEELLAAKDARIKALEADRDHQSKLSNKLNRSHAALEAKLAAAEKALETKSAANEALSKSVVESIDTEKRLREALELIADIDTRPYRCASIARAALGGKPL